MKSFPIKTDEPCELCEGETTKRATQLVVMDGMRWFGSRLVVCDECKQQVAMGSVEIGELGEVQ